MHMGNALQLLDAAMATPVVGAHLDLAICRLREFLSLQRADQEDWRNSEKVRLKAAGNINRVEI